MQEAEQLPAPPATEDAQSTGLVGRVRSWPRGTQIAAGVACLVGVVVLIQLDAAGTWRSYSASLQGARSASLETSLAAAQGEASDSALTVSELKAEVAALTEQMDDVLAELVAEAERADNAEERIATAEERARAAAERDISQREQRLEERIASFDEDEQARLAALDEREAAVTQQEAVAARATFGSGTWQVGVDIDPGRYRAVDAGSGCYWARLRSDGDSIIQNYIQLEAGQASVVIQASDGYFETQGCGTWTKG